MPTLRSNFLQCIVIFLFFSIILLFFFFLPIILSSITVQAFCDIVNASAGTADIDIVLNPTVILRGSIQFTNDTQSWPVGWSGFTIALGPKTDCTRGDVSNSDEFSQGTSFFTFFFLLFLLIRLSLSSRL